MLRQIIHFVLTGLILCFPLCEFTFAKLPAFSLDYYIRNADIIAIGQVQQQYSNLVQINVVECFYGTAKGIIEIGAHPKGEDSPIYQIGERAVFFLKLGKGNRYECVQGASGKINIRGDKIETNFFPYKEKSIFLCRIKEFVNVKAEKSKNKQIALLINLLDCNDIFMITSVSSYLNYLINGSQTDPWDIKPSDEEDWDYQEYYKKNALYKKKKWNQWWISHKRKTVTK